MLLFNDQGTSGGHGLEPHVGMVEIGTRHAERDVDLVVEEVKRWNGPLGCEWCPVAEWGHGLG